MRRFLSLRWLGLHAAMVVIVTGFLALGWWQLHRAIGGNALSWGYTFEWPLFAGFVVVFWIKVMRDEVREEPARDGAQPGQPAELTPAAPDSAVAPLPGLQSGVGVPSSPEEEEDEELAAYNAYLSRLNAEASRTSGRLAGRASRRQAATWARKPAGRTEQGTQPSAPGNSPHMEV